MALREVMLLVLGVLAGGATASYTGSAGGVSFTLEEIGGGKVRLQMTGPAKTWFGVGIGSSKMSGAQAVIAHSKVEGQALTSHSPGSGFPVTLEEDTTQGDTRKVVVSFDATATVTDPLPFITAVGKDMTYAYHGSRTSGSAQKATPPPSTSTPPPSTSTPPPSTSTPPPSTSTPPPSTSTPPPSTPTPPPSTSKPPSTPPPSPPSPPTTPPPTPGTARQWVLTVDKVSVEVTEVGGGQLRVVLEGTAGRWLGMGFGKKMEGSFAVVAHKAVEGWVLANWDKGTKSNAKVSLETDKTQGAVRRVEFMVTPPSTVALTADLPLILAEGGSMDYPSHHASKGSGSASAPPPPTTKPQTTPSPIVPSTTAPIPPTPPPASPEREFSADFRMKWKTSASAITFTLTCRTGVWCAIGFGKGMSDADTLLCAPDNKCVDGYSNSLQLPTADAQDDVQDLVVKSEGGFTAFTFSRKLDTGDAKDKVIPSDGSVDIIWATGGYSGAPQQHSMSSRNYYGRINFASGVVDEADDHSNALLGWVLAWSITAVAAGATLALRRFLPLPESEAGRWLFKKPVGAVLLAMAGFASAVVVFVFNDTELRPWYWPLGPVLKYLLAIQMFLPSRRYPLALWLLGVPFERIIPFHRALGLVIPVVATVHGFGFILNSDTKEYALTWTTDGHANPLAGFLAWIAMVLLVILALPPVRRKVYEVFLASHYILVTLIVIFSGLHSASVLFATVPGLLLSIIGHVASEARAWSYITKATKAGGYAKLEISGAIKAIPSPGAYVYFRASSHAVPGMQSDHPFSVVATTGVNTVTICVKNMGPATFTEQLTANARDGCPVKIEGPYGKPSVDPRRYDKVLLLAGGIGVTPMLGTLDYLSHTGAFAREVEMQKQAPSFGGAPMALQGKYELHWSVRDGELVGLLAPELEGHLGSLSLSIVIYYTGKTPLAPSALSNHSRVTFVNNRPEFGSVVRGACAGSGMGDAKTPMLLNDEPPGSLAVLICGPPPMVADAQRAAGEKMQIPVDVHTETFLL